MKISMMSFCRSNWFAVLLVFVALVVWLGFVFYVDPKSLRSDQYPLLFSYDKIMTGQYSWTELWEPKGGHRFPGYQILFYLNLYIFGFSPKVEIMLAYAVFSAASIYLVSTFSKSFQGKWKFGLILLFVLTLLNAQTLRLSLYSLIAMRLFDFAGFLALAVSSFYLLNPSDSSKPLKRIFGHVVLAAVTILLFGRGWGMAAVASIIGLVVLHGMIQVLRDRDISLVKHFAHLAFLLVVLCVYFVGLGDGGVGKQGVDIQALARYYVLKLGNANVGLFSDSLARIDLLNGFVGGLYMLSAVGFSLNILMREKLNIQNWIALFLIYFSLAAALLVAISRYDDGSYYFYRHNLEISLGAVGMFYLYFSSFINTARSPAIKARQVLLAVLACLICLGLMSNSFDVLQKKRLSKKYQVGIENQLVANRNSEEISKNDFQKMQCRMSVQRCQELLELMEKYNVTRTVTEFNPEFEKRRRSPR